MLSELASDDEFERACEAAVPHLLHESNEINLLLRAQLKLHPWPEDARRRLAIVSHALALEHHSAFLLLIQNGNAASALTLYRPAFETAVRGHWFWYGERYGADEKMIQAALPSSGMTSNEPDLKKMIGKIRKFAPGAIGQRLAEMYRIDQKHLNEFTHGNRAHREQMMTAEKMGQLHHPLRLLLFAAHLNGIMHSVGCGLADIFDDEALPALILKKMEGRGHAEFLELYAWNNQRVSLDCD